MGKAEQTLRANFYEGQTATLKKQAQERAGVEGQLHEKIKQLKEEPELRDVVATEEAQELRERIKQLEDEAAENAGVGSKRARGGGARGLHG